MKVEILCIGKLKEGYWREALAEYSKRLSRFCKFVVTELPETKLPENAGSAEEQMVIRTESEALLKKLSRGPNSYSVALAVKGKQLSSEELAQKMADLSLDGKSEINFVIGGSLGMSQELLSACDYQLSFSKMTFPHQLMRVILSEQIYRAFKINANETYHK